MALSPRSNGRLVLIHSKAAANLQALTHAACMDLSEASPGIDGGSESAFAVFLQLPTFVSGIPTRHFRGPECDVGRGQGNKEI